MLTGSLPMIRSLWSRPRQSSDRSRVKQEIESPNEDEKAWITSNLKVARSIVAAYGTGPRDTLDPGTLDEALVAWANRPQKERIEPNDLVNALGIAFGQLLVETLGMKWMVATDEQGADLAVHSMPGDILIFPTVAVAKRVESGEAPFFKELYAQMSADVARIRRQVH